MLKRITEHARMMESRINALKNSINIGDSIIINDPSWAYEKGKKPQLFKQVSFMDDNALENIIRGEVGVVLSEPRCEELYVEFFMKTNYWKKKWLTCTFLGLGLPFVCYSRW